MDEQNQNFMDTAIHEFNHRAEEKYIDGYREHDEQNLVRMNARELIAELKGEIIDQWFYLCALERELGE